MPVDAWEFPLLYSLLLAFRWDSEREWKTWEKFPFDLFLSLRPSMCQVAHVTLVAAEELAIGWLVAVVLWM